MLGIFWIDLNGAGWLALLQSGQSRPQQALLLHGFLVTAAHFAHNVLESFFNTFHIGQHELCVDGIGICNGINVVRDMHHITIFKTADHMGNGIGLADIGQKLIAQPLALACAFDQPSDVYKGHPCRNYIRRICDLCQIGQARVGHIDLADIGFNRTKWKIRRLR